jgi:hypothetical protein
VIGSNVSTSSVTAYDWNGLRLLDTPGIHAGFPDHDEQTYAAMDGADLLVFVITNELFDDTIGRHFRELAFTRQHGHKMLLVVNKMAQDPGTPETKRGDIETVTSPRTAAEFRTVFIDARCWLEAQEATSADDRADLLEIANFGALVGAVNAFAAERGLAGRLSAPLFTIRAVAEQAHALLAADFPEERAALELLHRKRRMFLESRSRLRTAIEGLVARAVADMACLGHGVAEAIEPGRTEEEVQALHKEAQQKVKLREQELSTQAEKCVDLELQGLQGQLDTLHNGALARDLRARLGAEASGQAYAFAIPAWDGQWRTGGSRTGR